MSNIIKVANKLGLSKTNISVFSDNIAKINEAPFKKKGKLVLVTAINPTPAGEGKTTVSIGLNDALRAMGKKSVVVLREPSLGPVFGMKGGATGGGKAQIKPGNEINLHFTGDIHAITSANNLIAASIDNHIYWGNALKIKEVIWKRCLDMSDRSLRNIKVQLKKDVTIETSFQITAASEIMAIFTLAKDIKDLRKKINNIIFGYDTKNKPLFVESLNITDSIIVLLKDSLRPNLVSTLEDNPAIIHGGPFANIAHGCNSIIATKQALGMADIVVTEAGFGADLGAEKFINIKTRQAKIDIGAVVIVATIKALKMHGGVSKENLSTPNIKALEKGLEILEKHITNIKGFKLPYVVALNIFADDSKEEKDFMKTWSKTNNHLFSFIHPFTKTGEQNKELAQTVFNALKENKISYTYKIKDPIKEKIEKIAKTIYGAKGVKYSPEANKFIKFLEKNDLDKQYICMAKTPASISDDAKLLGAPTNWVLNVKNVSISNGANMIVVHCGSALTMPGLPKHSQAEKIEFKNNKIYGVE